MRIAMFSPSHLYQFTISYSKPVQCRCQSFDFHRRYGFVSEQIESETCACSPHPCCSELGRNRRAFTDTGYILVAANYRFVPKVSVKEMTGDIAKAIRWIHDHAKDYGGDPTAIFVMGHSAGAHLAALVCTDERY